MLSLPKGGGAISGIGEKFAANPVTGTGSVSVPMYTSPGRSGFGPQLQLTYDSGSGNGPFGFGWSLALPTISRKTDKGLPQYGKSEIVDTFMLAGAEDLVPVCIEVDGDWVPHSEMRTMSGATYRIDRYRPGIETQFASIERWSNQADSADVFWRTISKENVTSWFGVDAESRVADPANTERIFSWLLSLLHDDKGNVARYRYRSEDSVNVPVSDLHERNRDAAARGANIYLKRVQFGNRTPFSVDPDAPLLANVADDWCFELMLDYGDHAAPTVAPDSGWACRDDPFSTYRSGFEVRTYRLCRKLMMFHHFPDDVDTGDACLVRSTDLRFTEAADADAPHFSLLASVSQTG